MKSINLKVIFNLSGVLLLLNALFMLLSTLVSYYFDDQLTIPFLSSGIFVGITGFLMMYFSRDRRKQISKRDGYLVVFLGWAFLILTGCIPYFSAYFFLSEEDLLNNEFNIINIFFETVSGYTATGSSIFNDPQNLPKSLLFWRSTTNWIGGMGIIVLTIAILPFLGIGGRQLFMAEAPGIYTDKIHPRITETAKNLWILYVAITLIFTILLYFSGMNWFDAANHSMSAISTGGFSTKNIGIQYWIDSPSIQYLLIVLMFIGGTNFALIYLLTKGQIKKIWQNEEFRWYIALITAVTLFIFTFLLFSISNVDINIFSKIESVFRTSLFHVVSVISTTAFYYSDYTQWFNITSLIFFSLFFIGGSSGSTSGGITIIRHVILLKNSLLEFKRILHPNAILPVRYNDKSLQGTVVYHVMSFFVIYMFTWIASSGLFSLLNYGMDMSFKEVLTSLSLTASTLGNVGHGIGGYGPGVSMNTLTDSAKILCSFLMILGRLELFTVLILFTTYFWKNN